MFQLTMRLSCITVCATLPVSHFESPETGHNSPPPASSETIHCVFETKGCGPEVDVLETAHSICTYSMSVSRASFWQKIMCLSLSLSSTS